VVVSCVSQTAHVGDQATAIGTRRKLRPSHTGYFCQRERAGAVEKSWVIHPSTFAGRAADRDMRSRSRTS